MKEVEYLLVQSLLTSFHLLIEIKVNQDFIIFFSHPKTYEYTIYFSLLFLSNSLLTLKIFLNLFHNWILIIFTLFIYLTHPHLSDSFFLSFC